ncbi:MAG: NUDIX hydrolase [Patescibacteria group bacterium]
MKPAEYLQSLYKKFDHPLLANFKLSDLDNNINYRFGAFVLATREDKVVLIRRQPDKKFPGIENSWWIPGGSQKDDEQLDITAMRELKEETGLVCTLQRTLLAELVPDRLFIAVTFRGLVIDGKISTDNDPDKTTAEVKYFSRNSVPFTKLWLDSDKITLVQEKFANGKITNLIANNGFK